ncbi:hypothetical protein ACYZTM_03005 [Pseudomonas sp. MDT2-39-1]
MDCTNNGTTQQPLFGSKKWHLKIHLFTSDWSIYTPVQTTLTKLKRLVKMSWKDNPGIVAALSAAGTLAFGYSTLLPIYTQHLTVKIENIEKSALITTEKLNKAESKLSEISKKYTLATSDNLFSEGSPYPLGWREVQLGMPYSKIKETYEKTIRDTASYSSVKNLEHGIFSEATFYQDRDHKFITAILFFFSEKAKESVGGKNIKAAMISLLLSAYPDSEVVNGEQPDSIELKQKGKTLLKLTETSMAIYFDSDPNATKRARKSMSGI